MPVNRISFLFRIPSSFSPSEAHFILFILSNFSTDQAEGESPEYHEKHARFYAETKDWEIKEIDLIESGMRWCPNSVYNISKMT